MTHDELNKNCAAIHELIPAYCLGGADPDEALLVEEHLAVCPEAVAEAADYASLADVMLFSAPVVEPPAGLADRLLAATAVTAHPVAAAQMSASPLPVAGTSKQKPSVWQRLSAAFAVPSFRPLPVMAALALVALLVVNIYLVNQVGQLQSSFDALQGRVGEQVAVLTQVGEGTYLRIGLPSGPAGEATAAYGAIVCNPEQPQGFLLAENLPQLAAGQSYHVWLGKGDVSVNAGTFQPDADGYGRLVFTAPEPMGQYDSLRITSEPASGSDGPTTEPVIGGSLYGEQYQS